METVYRIHPGIGIARMGNSNKTGEEGYFVGPEVPGQHFSPAPSGKYRDNDDRIRRQAQRFRIYEYAYDDQQNLKGIREITDAEAKIEWQVHLANTKSFLEDADTVDVRVPNDPGPISISGQKKIRHATGEIFDTSVRLGTLRTDEKGRLLVEGSRGRTGSLPNAGLGGLFNAGWFDDAADGPVTATVELRDGGPRVAADSAWIIVSVPAYAEPIINIVTLYDLAYDQATKLPPPIGMTPPLDVSFTKHIYPVLRRAVDMQWVSPGARIGHVTNPSGSLIEEPRFGRLRNNSTIQGSPEWNERMAVFRKLKPIGNMPRLASLEVTELQYALLERWSRGDFMDDWQGTSPAIPLEQLPVDQQPQVLDEAALSSIVGGSFEPGIEVGRIAREVSTFDRPFRINRNLLAGALTEQLSVPWQADFTACGTGWWPGARPNAVTANGNDFYQWIPGHFGMADVVRDWWKLGFLIGRDRAGSSIYVEDERLLGPPLVS